MKSVLLDARFWSYQDTGLGRYVRSLVLELVKRPLEFRLKLLISDKAKKEVNQLGLPYQLVNARAYSWQEQWLVPKAIWQMQPDLVHFSHINVPLVCPVPMVVTVHDLIKHQWVGSQTTRLPAWQYWFKHHVYRQLVARTVNKAHRIITPSQFTAQQVEQFFPAAKHKLIVGYEAPDPVFFAKSQPQSLVKGDYLIYVGNLYPHKNVDLLLAVVRQLHDQNFPIKLVLVGARDLFLSRYQTKASQLGIEQSVVWLQAVSDQTLRDLYAGSLAYVTASYLEGFGLPGLEAMASGTLVISANRSCLPEVYGQSAWYFDPDSKDELTDLIIKAKQLPTAKRRLLIKRNQQHARQFTWSRLAETVHQLYTQLLE